MTFHTSEKNISFITESLKETVGGIPSYIEDNVCHLSFNGDSFICDPCEKLITVIYYDNSVLPHEYTSEQHDVSVLTHQDTTNRINDVTTHQDDNTSKNKLQVSTYENAASSQNTNLSRDNLFSEGANTIQDIIPNQVFETNDDNSQQIQNDTVNKHNKIVNKDATTENFKDHFLSDDHKQNIPHGSLVYESLINIFSDVHPEKFIPPIIIINIPFMSVDCTEKSVTVYECNLCKPENGRLVYCRDNCRVVYCGDISETEKNFLLHFLSDNHKEKRIAFNEKQKEVKENLEKIYGYFPFFLLDNVEFIKKEKSKYLCTLCNVKVRVCSSDVDQSVEMFKKHFQSADHKRAVDTIQAKRKIPELVNIYPQELPFYVNKNIDYIEYYNWRFFCTLCQEIIYSEYTSNYDTEADDIFRNHMSSPKHSGTLFIRYHENKVCQNLSKLFDTFPVDVIEGLQFFGRKGNDFYCQLCKCKIKDHNDYHYTEKNILSHFVPRYKDVFSNNSIHGEQLYLEEKRCKTVVQDLKNEFPVPEIVANNMEYLRFCDSNRFIECDICDVKRPFYPDDATSTLNSLEQHLKYKLHKSTVTKRNKEELDLKRALEERCTIVPQFVLQNLKHIMYTDTSENTEYDYYGFKVLDSDSSDDEYYLNRSKDIERKRVAGTNFYCRVCKRVIIAEKQSEYKYDEEESKMPCKLTEHNLRLHLLSKSHKRYVNGKCFNAKRTKYELDSLFKNIPNYLYNNIYYINKKNQYRYECTLCDESVGYNLKDSLMKHHFVSKYELGKVHRKNVESLKEDMCISQEIIAMRFWSISKLIMLNLDFLSILGNNFFCELCQETLFVTEYDLDLTQSEFLRHLSSTKHKLCTNIDYMTCDALFRSVCG
uniref:Uncharacterized protein n=1 Tax=Cuerna arida TaxID=1464854 RepID=A0A1B6F9N9_9HEMI